MAYGVFTANLYELDSIPVICFLRGGCSKTIPNSATVVHDVVQSFNTSHKYTWTYLGQPDEMNDKYSQVPPTVNCPVRHACTTYCIAGSMRKRPLRMQAERVQAMYTVDTGHSVGFRPRVAPSTWDGCRTPRSRLGAQAELMRNPGVPLGTGRLSLQAWASWGRTAPGSQ